ncbi:MAG: hypothetical protein M3128_02515 [Verrucomicrobiota bacterium]|nr:hypothetical protein [Verrucomicrobiota bacterium]
MVALRRAVAPLLLLAIGILFFPAGGRDDAHIGYWVALGLSRFGRVINYNGEAIEQSSTLLHALLLAAAHRLSGIDMIILGHLSAIVFGVAAVLLTQQLATRVDRRLAVPTGLLTASSAYFAYWSFGGMEATLCALLAVWIVLLFGDFVSRSNERLISAKLLWIAVAMLAFLLVRPEQPLVLFCMLIGAAAFAFWRRDYIGQRIIPLVVVAVVMVAAIFLWRWHTFGSLFPQPVSAKSGSLSAHTLKSGLRYYRKQIILEPGVALFTTAALAGIFFAIRKILREKTPNAHLVFALLFFGSYAAFVLLAGGDWMEAGRFVVPLLPIAALFVAFALSQFSPSRARIAAIVLALAQVSAIYRVAAHDSTAIPFWSSVTTEPYATEMRSLDFTWFERANRPNLRDIPTVRRLDALVRQLRAAKSDAEPVRMMSAQLGMVAYYVVGRHFGHVEILDRRGLVDRRFSSCPLLGKLDRTAGGLQLNYEYYFAHRAELERDCAIPRPDIIFDIGDAPVMSDYTVVYTQTGTIRTDSRFLPGSAFRASQFIAVRNDWLPALHAGE